MGELEPSELTLALIVADLACVPMQDNGIPLLFGLIPIAVLLALATVLSVLSLRSVRLRTLLCGCPSVVVREGMVVERELRRNRLTLDELLEELRIQGYTDLRTIQTAVLETNGRLSVLPRAEGEAPHRRSAGREDPGARGAGGAHQRRPLIGGKPAPAGL